MDAPAAFSEFDCEQAPVGQAASDLLRGQTLDDDPAALDAHRASDHFARLAAGGLFPIVESRSPELDEPLGD